MPDDGPLAATPTSGGSAPVGDPASVPRGMPGSIPANERFGRDRRVHSPRDFARVRREGRAVSGGRLTLAYVAHVIPGASTVTQAAAEVLAGLAQEPAQPDGPARVGFIVGKRVGGAVVRNRVRRRLREIMRRRLRFVLPGWDLVLIARPPAAQATSADLAHDVVVLLRRARLLIPGYDGAE